MGPYPLQAGLHMDFERSNLTFKSQYDKAIEDLITRNSISVDFPRKKVFLVAGDSIDYLFYVQKGVTKHYMVNACGLEKVLYKLSPGWLFGETAYTLNKPTGLYSQAETDVTLRKIPWAAFSRLVATNQEFARYVMVCNCSKLLILRYEIENLTFNSVKDRIKRFYAASVNRASVVDHDWYDVKIHTTQSELGVIVGAARVTVNKHITELCDEKFIRIVNRSVQVNAASYDRYMEECGSSE